MSRSSTSILVAIAVAVSSIALLQNLVIPLVPLIQAEFGVTADAASWTMTAWLIAAAVATPTLGRIGDLRGRRTTFLITLGVTAAGDVLAAIAPTLEVLIVARVLQGVGGALFPLAYGLLRDALPRERVTGAIGVVSAVIGIGGAAGTVLAGPLADLVGWRGTFAVPFLVAALGAFLTLAAVRDSGARARGRVNTRSSVLLSTWLVALLVPLSTGSRWGWTSPAVLALFGLAVLAFAAWIVSELRSAEPLVDLRLLASPAIWPVNAASLLIGAGVFAFWGYLPQFLELSASAGGSGLTVRDAGLMLVPMLIGMSGVGFATGALNRILSLRTLLVIGALLMGASGASAALAHSSPWQLALAGAGFGIGCGLAYAASAGIVVQSVPASVTGVATGVNANLRTIGSAIGSAATGAIVFGSAPHGTGSGFATAWGLVAVVTILAGAIVWAVRTRPRVTTSATALPELVEA
ncbi:MFS transporter [Microbacterium sp. Au-Mic1]|uniref:MFS transporter n=1 Tax=Microbacterium sp. Au-Mic1 TaxID=2906457 RepID=UPI001E414E59|nr:MFS transporter [Microbacterium sp. Au-Mic1]MCE4027075.1 MFS transporter [Microbacterium sp. Au-Mic1]